jgi:hypothetical protein
LFFISQAQNRSIHIEPRITEEEKKRIQLETLQKLKDMAGKYPFHSSYSKLLFLSANDTLDLSRLTIDDLKKAVDVPKQIRSNQGAIIMYQMDEIRKLVRRKPFVEFAFFFFSRSKN